MNRSILFISVFLYGLLILTSAIPEKDDPILEELLATMRKFDKIGDKDKVGYKNDTEKKTIEVTTLTQDVSVSVESCPNVTNLITNPSSSLTAICTEITYECTDKSHVLVFKQHDEMCLKRGKTSKHCNIEVVFEPPTCQATCVVEEVDNASWEILGKNSLLINGNTVIAGSLIKYTCDIGFKMFHSEEGPVTPLNCTEDGDFDKAPPNCKATDNIVTVTGCGKTTKEWTRLIHFNMSNVGDVCPLNWQKTERHGIVGCTSRIMGGCSRIYIELRETKFSSVCGKAVGHQIAFPDAFAVPDSNDINKLYVDGLSITFGDPKEHIWTYSVGASKGKLFGGTGGNCPCDRGRPEPDFVRGHMYCDSGHRSSAITGTQQLDATNAVLYSEVHNHTLWTDTCGKSEDSTCCGEVKDKIKHPDVVPPWFRRDDLEFLDNKNPQFDIRLCTHEIDMQEGALITQFELYIQ